MKNKENLSWKRKVGLILRIIAFILIVISIGEAINILDLTIARIIRSIGLLVMTIGVYLGCCDGKINDKT